MIRYAHGVVKELFNQGISLQVGPIGLMVAVPDSSLFILESETTIQLHLHWNQEQGPTLYGFQTSLERTIFLLVTSCPGIGPKIGLAVLADLGAEGFVQAVQMADEKMLSKVSGIGAKKAEQMIVQLKSKVAKMLDSGVVVGGAHKTEDWHTLTQALQSLNYSRGEITGAVGHLKKTLPQEAGFDQLMRQALALLSKQLIKQS